MRYHRTIATFALLWLGIGVATSSGALVGRLAMVCPVDGNRFEGVGVRRDSSVAGVDRDLYRRSGTFEGVFCLINTCPKCLYSGYVTDFNPSVKVPEEVQRKILSGERLTELARETAIAPGIDQLDIPATLRYALADQVYQWVGKSDEALAWLRLRSAWASREAGSILPKDERIDALLSRFSRMLPAGGGRENQADRELELATRIGDLLVWSQLAPQDRPLARFIRAFLLRRHGEVLAARGLFKRLQSDESVPEKLKKTIPTILATIDAELKSLAGARDRMMRAVEGKEVAKPNLAAAVYLVAETSRRIGDYEAAIEWYDRAREIKGIAPNLKTWAEEQRDLAKNAAKKPEQPDGKQGR